MANQQQKPRSLEDDKVRQEISKIKKNGKQVITKDLIFFNKKGWDVWFSKIQNNAIFWKRHCKRWYCARYSRSSTK